MQRGRGSRKDRLDQSTDGVRVVNKGDVFVGLDASLSQGTPLKMSQSQNNEVPSNVCSLFS